MTTSSRPSGPSNARRIKDQEELAQIRANLFRPEAVSHSYNRQFGEVLRATWPGCGLYAAMVAICGTVLLIFAITFEYPYFVKFVGDIHSIQTIDAGPGEYQTWTQVRGEHLNSLPSGTRLRVSSADCFQRCSASLNGVVVRQHDANASQAADSDALLAIVSPAMPSTARRVALRPGDKVDITVITGDVPVAKYLLPVAKQ